MIRSVASKVAWVGRTVSMVFGLALVLALLFGVASMAFAADGQSFLLGARNVASSVSTLVKQGSGPALKLQVGAGQPPLAVNSSAKVENLHAEHATLATRANFASNADAANTVDGSEGELWAQIWPDGLAENWKGMTGNIRSEAGEYVIKFNRDVGDCAYLASLSMPVLRQNPGYVTVTDSGFDTNTLVINTYNSSGAPADRAFHVVVFCGDHQSAP